MQIRLASFASALLSVGLVSCGGSTATPAPSHASTQSSWQVVLTLNGASSNSDPLAGGGFGIAGTALDGRGNLYLTEMDDALIYEYTTAGELVRKWGGYGSDPGQLTYPEKLAFDAQGNLYVTEFGSPSFGGSQGENDRIQKFSPTGTPLARWGHAGVRARPVQWPGGHRR